MKTCTPPAASDAEAGFMLREVSVVTDELMVMVADAALVTPFRVVLTNSVSEPAVLPAVTLTD